MPNIWASECIHYLNLIYEKVWSIGKVTLNCFPQGLVLFLDCAVLFLKSHVCINTEALQRREAGPLWCCYSSCCTCRTGSFSCKFFLEPINKTQVNQYVLFLKQLPWCAVVFLQKIFLRLEHGGTNVFARAVIKKTESWMQWHTVLIPEGTFLSLHFMFQHNQDYVGRTCLQKAENEKVRVT